MKIQVWFIDTQKDFINDGGALQVPGAPTIVENLKRLNEASKRITRVFTQDLHHETDVELSKTPDFKTTFPPHCISGTSGCHIIEEINPKEYFNMSRFTRLEDLLKDDRCEYILQYQDYVFDKNIFSTFDGNPNAKVFVEATAPDIIFVCGVAGDVCVKAVVEALDDLNCGDSNMKIKIAVVMDAVKSLNEVEARKYFEMLEKEGTIQLVDTNYVVNFLKMTDGIGDDL